MLFVDLGVLATYFLNLLRLHINVEKKSEVLQESGLNNRTGVETGQAVIDGYKR